MNEDLDIYLGNDGAAALELTGCELFGFNIGAYEQRVVKPGDEHPHILPWRLQDDLSFVVVEKKLVPLCNFLHACVRDKGLAEIFVKDHRISSKLHEAYSISHAC